MSEEHPVIGNGGNTADPLIGTVLAERYRIERKLGEGGMGAVYLARHVILEKIVALKILHDEYARRRELVERFLHEAKAASRIRHEHVIDITDFGETATKNVFFAMEFLDGQDLATELDRIGPMPWPRVKSVILQICAALQAAHEAGVIHRDLKPENIYLIERLGNPDFVKVLDFGVAKLTELEESRERRLTRTGMVFGTPEYMSPEQARGEKPDFRVDVYAAGCILFELLTGDVPYRADNFMGVLTKHLFDPTPVLKERTDRTDYPDGLQAVLTQSLAKDKNQRFSSMNELAIAIDVLDTTDGVVYHAPGAERSRRNQAALAGTPSASHRAASSSEAARSARAPAPPVLPAPAPPPADPFDETHLDTPISSLPQLAQNAIADDEKTMPRIPAAVVTAVTVPPGEADVETDDFERLPKKKGTALYLAAGGAALALAVGAFVFLRPSATPDGTDDVMRPVAPVAPPTMSAPAAVAEPVPAPAPTPVPVAAPVPVDAAVAAPPPAPDAAPAVAPPVEPEPIDIVETPAPPTEKRPSRPHRPRDPRPRPIRVETPPPTHDTPPPVHPPAVTPTPVAPPPDPMVPKSDLKDPFRKK